MTPAIGWLGWAFALVTWGLWYADRRFLRKLMLEYRQGFTEANDGWDKALNRGLTMTSLACDLTQHVPPEVAVPLWQAAMDDFTPTVYDA